MLSREIEGNKTGLIQRNEYTILVSSTLNLLKKKEYNVLAYSANHQSKYMRTTIDEMLKMGRIKCNSSGNIYYIDLHKQALHGVVPSSLEKLVHLRYLDLSECQLTQFSSCIRSLDNLINLEVLDLSHNILSDAISPSLFNLINLQLLNLSHNSLSGSIPSSLRKLVNLQLLNLSNNKLTGAIPSFDNLKKLEVVDLTGCNICQKTEYDILEDAAIRWGKEDTEDSFIDTMLRSKETNGIKCNDKHHVIYIRLTAIKLYGTIPSSLCTLIHLDTLVLSDAGLSGSIPPSIGSLVNLKTLNLEKNSLIGSIPTSISSLVNLEVLMLSLNNLTGHIPSMASLVNLKILSLKGNQLVGTIPSSIGKLQRLELLELSGNIKLRGALPAMQSKNCTILTDGTKVSSIGIKTKPLEYWYDIMFVVCHVAIGYIDLAFDIVAIEALSHSNVTIMVLNIVFVGMNVMLGVWMSWPDAQGILLTVLQLDQLYQGYHAVMTREQTQEMMISKKLDAITRSMPSMILQLCGLLDSVAYTSIADANFWTLLLSIASSIIGASFTLASLAPNSGSSIFNIYFIRHFVYYNIELISRVVVLAWIFWCFGSYGFIVITFDFVIRLVYIVELTKVRLTKVDLTPVKIKFLDAILLTIQSFGSDHTYPGKDNILLVLGFRLTCLWLLLCVFYSIYLMNLRQEKVLVVVSLEAITIVTMLLRLLIYRSRVLDATPTDRPTDRNEYTTIDTNDDTTTTNDTNINTTINNTNTTTNTNDNDIVYVDINSVYSSSGGGSISSSTSSKRIGIIGMSINILDDQ